jgi:microcystin-dependent protein
MNHINFAFPNGFPLEADGTLGFMQTDYQSALGGLIGAYENCIVSGCQFNGNVVSDGWIVFNGELVQFRGGDYNAHFEIVERTELKPNEDGSMIPRYTTKFAAFSAAGQHEFALLRRLPTPMETQSLLFSFHNENAVIVSGCMVNHPTPDTLNYISAGTVLMGGNLYNVPVFEPLNPVEQVYLQRKLGGVEWVNAPNLGDIFISFAPKTSQYLADVKRRNSAYWGEVRILAVRDGDFDASGRGRFSMLGWAICNGQNGTVNLQNKTVRGAMTSSEIGAEGGSDTVSLSVENMPSHNHGMDNVPQGGYGLMRRSVSGQSVTVVGVDAVGSGNEPDLVSPPAAISPQGGGRAFDVTNKHLRIQFIQRI